MAKRLTAAVLVFLLVVLAACTKAEEATTTTEATTTSTTGAGLVYIDPSAPVADRVEDLLGQMTQEEKIGQMTLIEKGSLTPEDVTARFIGGVLSGGGGAPDVNSPEAWLEMVTGFKQAALDTRLGIPLIYGVDSVHGHNNVKGAVIFPHNIGLGATRDPALMEEIGRVTATETAATGIFWNYAPAVSVPQDIRWGRTYEGYSEQTAVVTELSRACVRGLQGEDLADPDTVLATIKHYVGDGGTTWGTSTTGDYKIDQGKTQVDEATLRALHLPPYPAAIEEGALNVMASYSSWTDEKMHGQAYLLTDVLKGELGFSGFVVADWGGVDQVVPGRYDESVIQSINAGVDMNMVPYDFDRFIKTLTEAVEAGDVSEERIDDAVRRILTAKFELGLFEQPLPDESLLATVGSAEHREVARRAVRQSLVLLKNDGGVLPLAKDTGTIFVAGTAADDIGTQLGGWSISWQGSPGNTTSGTTLYEGVLAAVDNPDGVYYDRFGRFEDQVDESGAPLIADVAIVVAGEKPYAEGVGDSNDLSLLESDRELIGRVAERAEQLVVVLYSGRPMIITDQLDQADAFVAAWLPGTEGAGITDVLFGDHPFTGKLSYTWPRAMNQLPFDLANLPTEECAAPLFPSGYGLDTTDTQPLVLPDCSVYDTTTTTVASPPHPWSRVTHDEAVFGGSGFQGMFGVTAGGPGLVAVGGDGPENDWWDAAVWTSPDGVSWSRVAHNEAIFGGAAGQGMFSVTVGGPGLVAVGMDGDPGGDSDAAVWTSPDGVSWSRVAHHEAVFGAEAGQWMEGVTVGGPGLVAVGWDGPEDAGDAAVWVSDG